MASIQYVVSATDNMSRVLDKISLSADGLDRQLSDLSKRIATPEVDLKDAKFTLGMVNAAKRLDKLSAMVADPEVNVDTAKAQTEILRINAMLDRLGKKDETATVTIRQRLDKAAGASFLQPSGAGAALALSPALIPAAAALSGAVAAIGVSFGAAMIGAGAFGLVAKSALTQAGTAASAVETANNQYKASLIAIRQQYAANAAAATTHAQKAAALATEQRALTAAGIAQTKAINLAYAEMTPAQIRLSKAIGNMQNAWQGVQQATTPMVSGALVPWIRDVSLLMKDLAPLIRPVADLFGYWGQVLHKYLSSGAGSTEIGKMADELGRFSAAQLSNIINFVVDVGKGIANLGADLAGHNVDFYAFGKNMQGWGDSFAAWSKTVQARQDVGAFLKYVRDNGARLTTIVKDLAKFIPGIFAGASTAGTLELQALSGLLGLIAKLPPSFGKPLVELAGALLLLSKTGVLKIGLQVLGVKIGSSAAEGAAAAAEGGAAAGLWSKLLPGVRLAAAGLAIDLVITSVLKNTPSGKGGNWFDNPFGGANPSDPGKGGPPNALSSWDQLGKDIANIWNSMWTNVVGRTIRGARDSLAGFGILAGKVPPIFDGIRHDTAGIWDTLWNNTVTQTVRGGHDVEAKFDDFRHRTAVVFDGIRHDIAHIWDLIFSDTIGRVVSGGHDVEAKFDDIRSKIFTIMDHLPGQLWNLAKTAIENIVKGAQSVVPSITSFFSGFAHGIVDIFHKIWGWFSPSAVMFAGGKALMDGLELGIKAHAHKAIRAASVVAHQVASAGAGVQQWAGLVRKALAMEGLSQNLLGNVLYQMQTESGGNPNAINNWDINARMGDPSRGLMQVIGSTFAAYHWPGTSNNIYDPLANIAAALNYARHVYGPALMSGGMGIGSGHGYAAGSWNVPYTGPAVVHQGEMIIPAAAAAAVRAGGRRSGPLLNIENFNNYNATDEALLMQKVSFAITAASLGS